MRVKALLRPKQALDLGQDRTSSHRRVNKGHYLWKGSSTFTNVNEILRGKKAIHYKDFFKFDSGIRDIKEIKRRNC